MTSTIREYLITYTVRGTGERRDDTVYGADAETAIRNLREGHRRKFEPGEEIRRLGVVIDSVEMQEGSEWTTSTEEQAHD